MVREPKILQSFLPEPLAEPLAHRAFEFGRGIAELAGDVQASWSGLRAAHAAADPSQHNITVLGGFVYQANLRASDYERRIWLPPLSTRSPPTPTSRESFPICTRGSTENSPIFRHISILEKGIEVALDILSIAFHTDQNATREHDEGHVELGHA